MTAPRRFLFFLNAGAGSGQAVRIMERLLKQRREELAGEIVPIENLDQVRRELGNRPDGTIPVSAGGDGTLNLMVRAVRAEGPPGVPLGLLPLGTGNAIAHSFGLNRMDAAVNALLRGRPMAADAMITTHPAAPLALASISFGFEARVMTAASRFTTWHRLAAGLTEAARAAPATTRGIQIDLDGVPWLDPDESFFVAGLYNLRCYALGLLMFPEAALDDGRAEAAMHPTALSYVQALARVRAGRSATGPTGGGPAIWRVARVASPDSIQLDGEGVPGGEFEAHVEGRAYRLLR